ncbi:MAG: TonB-dependent receptor [Flavobacteriaceae bacterium]|nr:TonB-dependent receptor [Flavobacteriaceae bacterium]
MKNKITSIFLLVSIFVFAQNDSINKLEEIVLKGNFSSSFNSGYYIKIITDSILKNEYQSLGNLLQDQANLYFKQNGNGLVSSISLRGTGASHTGVYWNGIAINSVLNGQTDFNTLTANSFDAIEIRKGGASVLLGSGAIGGAINLSDRVVFFDKKEMSIHLGLGSYNTYATQFNALLSNQKIYTKISLGTTNSDNNYPYLDSDLRNDNGAYINYNINGVFAYRINLKSNINFYTSFLDNDRDISRTLTASGNAKLLNFNTRSLLDWKYLGNRFTSSLKLAYLTEKFTYFFDKNAPDFAVGKSNYLISKYDFTYFLNNTIFFNAGLEYRNEKGWGSSIIKEEQNIFNSHVLFHHQPIPKLNYNISIRKEYSSIFEVPLIYAVDGKYELTKQLTIKAAYSTNYRNPTFNDLYWNPGGNIDLKSEKSKSAEIGLDFNNKLFQFNITSYFIKSKDLIQWQPTSTNFWQPQNIQDVSNYGLELSASVKKRFTHHLLSLKIQYDYAISNDEELDKQLIYVPFHKANSHLHYQYKKWNFSYNLQYTGKVYTTTSNTEYIDNYMLSNINFYRNLLKDKIKIAFKINNLFDKNYQSVAYRPMPNRNYTLNINLKI